MGFNNTKSHVALSLLVGLFLVQLTTAQEEYGRVTLERKPDTLLTQNRSTISFERNLNTYLWNAGANYRQSFGPWDLRLRLLFRSSLIRTDQKFIKDEKDFGFLIGRKLSDRLGIQLDAASLIFSDNRAIGVNRASTHLALIGLTYNLGRLGAITPSVGVKFDNQLGQQDKGFSYRLTSQIGELDLAGYRMRFEGRLSEDLIAPRKGESHMASLAVHKEFVQHTTNTLTTQFQRTRRDFYFPADPLIVREFAVTNNIEQRIEEILEVTDELSYGAGKNWFLTFFGNLRHRSISKIINYKTTEALAGGLFDTDISEFKLETYIQAQYRGEKANGELRVRYSERDEKHEARFFAGADRIQFETRKRNEARKNNSSRQTALSGNLQLGLSRGNTLAISSFASLLRYDTPSAENTDDRDELLMIFGLSNQQALGRNLTLSLSADVVLNHLVYIFADRSANNNWNRVFRLSPRIDYRWGSSLRTTNAFEVLANYTVYDFEDQVFSVQSYSFRQFSFVDSTTYQLSRRVAFDFSVRLKLYERGQLRWREFKERPVNYFEDRTFSGQLRYSPSTGVSVAVGFRYFSLTRFRYQVRDRIFENRLVNYGPTCLIEWSMKQNSRLLLSGWYETQKQTNVASVSFSNIAMTINFGL